jgi:hypothetical protein
MSGSHLSKDFFELVKAIGESKSKQVGSVQSTPLSVLSAQVSCSPGGGSHYCARGCDIEEKSWGG